VKINENNFTVVYLCALVLRNTVLDHGCHVFVCVADG